MAKKIKIQHLYTTGSTVPSSNILELGEIALSLSAKSEGIYFKNADEEIVKVLTSGQTVDLINNSIPEINPENFGNATTSAKGVTKIISGDVSTVTEYKDAEAAASYHNHDLDYIRQDCIDSNYSPIKGVYENSTLDYISLKYDPEHFQLGAILNGTTTTQGGLKLNSGITNTITSLTGNMATLLEGVALTGVNSDNNPQELIVSTGFTDIGTSRLFAGDLKNYGNLIHKKAEYEQDYLSCAASMYHSHSQYLEATSISTEGADTIITVSCGTY